jgi:RNA polymerase sigma-70 factor (ECF subfamily)
LAKRLQSSDPKVIEEIYSLYFDRIYAFVFHSVKQDHATAEDIVQNVFVSAIKSCKGFKGRSKIYTWLVGIAHHKVVDYYRSVQKAPIYNTELLEDTDDLDIDLHSKIENRQLNSDSLQSDKMDDVVNQALSSLPVSYQQVLLLKYVEEMKVQEISKVMNRSPKSIEGLITRARYLLKKKLSEKS